MVIRAAAFVVLMGCVSQDARVSSRQPSNEKKGRASAAKIVEVPGSKERVYYYPGSGPIAGYAVGDRGPFLVEVRGRLTAEENEELRVQGVSVNELEMFTEHSFVTRLDAAQRERVAELPFVWEVRILQPDDKLDPTRFTEAAGLVPVTIDLLEVGEAKLAAIGKLLESLGAEVRALHSDTIHATVTLAHLDEITRISDVIWIEPSRN